MLMLSHFAATGAAGDRSTAGPHPDADSNSANTPGVASGVLHRITWQVTREVVDPEEPEEPGTPVLPAETEDSSSDFCTSRQQKGPVEAVPEPVEECVP